MDNDNLYARWLEGKISPEEAEELKSSGALEELETIIGATDALALPKYDTTKGYAQFKARHGGSKIIPIQKIQRRRNWAWLAAAASVALLIGTFWLINNRPNTLESGNQITLAHTFSDQTSVMLNDGSSLTYQEAEWTEERNVELIGEAIFNVQKGKPFIVNTTVGSVTVLGTSFNVRAWGDNLNVECYEGRVQVQYANQTVILGQGESVNGIVGQLEEKRPIGHNKPLWTEGNSKFYKEPLYRVFEELERQYDIEVIVPKIEKPFNGSFQHGDINKALNDICKPMNLQFSLSPDKKVVTVYD